MKRTLGLILFLGLGFLGRTEPTPSGTSPSISRNQMVVPEGTELTGRLDEFKQSIAVLGVEKSVALLMQAISNAPASDPWIPVCYNTIGATEFKAGEYMRALKAYEEVLKFPETLPGSHMGAQQMRMLCFEALGRFSEAADAANRLQDMSGPEHLKQNLVQRAMLHEAEMRIASAPSDRSERMKAEIVYKKAFSENTLAASRGRGQELGSVIRGRIRNLVELGETNRAVKVANEFLDGYPTDYYAPLVALDMMRLERRSLRLGTNDLEEICNKYSIESGAGAHVLYELAMAHLRSYSYPRAVAVSDKLLSMVVAPDDPMPVSGALLSSTLSVKAFAYEGMGELKKAREVSRELTRKYGDSANAQNVENSLANIPERLDPSTSQKVRLSIRVAVLSFAILSAACLIILLYRSNLWQASVE